MVKWEALARPKEFGGMGFMDIRVMNICLLGKWVDRLERGDESVCVELLRKKYPGNKSIFQIKNGMGSQFWRGILKVREWFQWGRKMKVLSGQQTRFWEDVWLGDCALKIEFDQLYKFCSDLGISVYDALEGASRLTFRRSLTEMEMQEWDSLEELVTQTQLRQGRDEMVWMLERKGKYTTRSLYRAMTNGGVRDPMLEAIWKCKIPLKIQIFLWMALHDRLQSAV